LAPRACLGGGAVIKERCFVGLNATIRDNITIAPGCFIAAGAVVTADTEPDGLYMGVPARRVAR
jgi:acetyltransferase-like isoleucine patch superfamily enzyme